MLAFLWMPENASEHGAQIDELILYIHILMGVMFLGWGLYFAFTLFRFRKSRQPKADAKGLRGKWSIYLEIAVAAIEAVLLIGFSIPIWNRVVTNLPAKAEAVEIRVVAEQFVWNIHYPGPDGQFGPSDVSLMDVATNPLGLDVNAPASADDITTVNQLTVPVGKPILIRVSSKDVIHSFSIPVMRVKQDCIPGMEIPVNFKATRTGNWEIACAQLCGLGHYRMRGFLNVVTQEEYDTWIAEKLAEKTAAGEQDDFWD
jgi:cytochrome c oxidase subunit 2